MTDAALQTKRYDANFSNRTQSAPGRQIAPLPRISIQAFCESAEVAGVIADAIADRRLAKTHAKIQMGGIPAAIEAFRESPTPNLILLETFAPREMLFQQLDNLSTYCDSDTKVIVIGQENDIVLYRELIAHGISDYIVAPVDLLTLIGQLSLLYTSKKSQALGRSICVIGAKGGVGASTIAHISRGRSHEQINSIASLLTSICRLEQLRWTLIRIRHRDWRMRSIHPIGSTRPLSIGC